MFIDFVTYLEVREDLSEEDTQYINSEIEKYMKKYKMKRDGIKYYAETKRPYVGFHVGNKFCIMMNSKRYKDYIKRCDYNSYFEGEINVKDPILDYYNNERIKWIPVKEGYPDNPRRVLCTYKYDYDSGSEYEISIGEYWGFSEELKKNHPEECGFGRMHNKVIAWAELPKPFIPEAKE